MVLMEKDLRTRQVYRTALTRYKESRVCAPVQVSFGPGGRRPGSPPGGPRRPGCQRRVAIGTLFSLVAACEPRGMLADRRTTVYTVPVLSLIHI